MHVIHNDTLAAASPRRAPVQLPFLAWEMALTVVYAITFDQLQDMQSPLAQLNMATHVIYRYSRVRATAVLAVTQVGWVRC